MTTPDPVPSSVPWPDPAEHAGYVLGGRYRLEERIAFGAMGSIWRGRHIELKSPVAIKFLDVAVTRETEMHGRFLQEARAAAAVRCSHVVQVFDYGREGSVPFLVMELLEGETLEQRLRRGVLTPRELDKIFGEVACGLRRVHATGIVHRDLKPSNIFIAREGSADVTKLIDFGIVKVDEARLGFTPRASTRAGTVIGTPEYMSPEQLRAGAEIDQSVDLWALAIVAFECLTGRLPFSGNSMTDLIVQICTEEAAAPSSLAQVPAGFDDWFGKATQKDLGRRFGSAEEMAAELSLVLQNASAASPEDQVRAARAPLRVPPRGVFRAVRAGWGAVLAQLVGTAHSPVRAGLLGIALLGVAIALALRPAPSDPAMVIGQLQPRPVAAEVAPPSTISSSPTPTPAPAPAPRAANVEPPAVAGAAPSARAAEAKDLPKSRRPTGPRPASAPLTVANAGGTSEPAKSDLEPKPRAPVLSRANRAEPSRSAASGAEVHPPGADADSLFAERL